MDPALSQKKTFEFLDPDLKVLDHVVSQKKTFEFLDPDLKAFDARKLLKKDGYMEKVKMKTNLEPLRTMLKM